MSLLQVALNGDHPLTPCRRPDLDAFRPETILDRVQALGLDCCDGYLALGSNDT